MIADAAHVRTVGNLPESLQDEKITPHLRSAKRRLQRWVGQTVYDAAQTEVVAADNDPVVFEDLTEKTAALGDAEAHLALAAGLASWNSVMETSGGDASGLSMSGSIGENEYRYMTPAEIKNLAEQHLLKAWYAAKDYFVDTADGGSPGPGISYARDKDGEAIDELWPESKVL